MTPAQLAAQMQHDGLFEKQLEFSRGAFLKTGGSMDTNIYFVRSGSLRFYILDELEERIIRFGYEGNLIVALDSFLTDAPSDFYVQAIKKTVVDVIPKARFMAWMDEKPDRLKLWSQILEDLVLQQMAREKDLLTQSPAQRYQRVKARSPQLFQEIPERHIANYLRMSPETLSRLKKS